MILSLVFHLTHITTIINRIKEEEEEDEKQNKKDEVSQAGKKQKELTRRIIIQIKYLDNRARNTHQQKIRILLYIRHGFFQYFLYKIYIYIYTKDKRLVLRKGNKTEICFFLSFKIFIS